VFLEVPFWQYINISAIGKNINNQKAVRAVAAANGENLIGLIITCHRIIGSGGELVGYAGGFSIKKLLLKLEQSNVILSYDEKY